MSNVISATEAGEMFLKEVEKSLEPIFEEIKYSAPKGETFITWRNLNADQVFRLRQLGYECSCIGEEENFESGEKDEVYGIQWKKAKTILDAFNETD